jgi:hypothetical protein
MKNWSALGLYILVSALLCGCSEHGGTQDALIHDVFGDKPRLDAFLAATNASAQRLHFRDGDTNANPTNLSGYDRSAPVPVPMPLLGNLKDVLQRPSSYEWGYSKACIADFGVLITCYSSQRIVSVALCFNCNWLGIFEGQNDNAEPINTKPDFDPCRPQLVSFSKSLFPSDPEIQALKPNH